MRKFLAFLLSFAMVLALVPAVTITASAADDVYTLVTDVSTLAAGDKVIIAAATADYAIGTTQNNNNRSAAAITKNGNNITPDTSVQVFTVMAGNQEGTFAFYTGSGYIFAPGDANALRTEQTLTNNSSWSVTRSNDVTSVVSKTSGTRSILRYNPNASNSNPLFACYASNSSIKNDVDIYKLEVDETSANKAELIALINEKSAINNAALFSEDGTDIYEDSTWLTYADYQANLASLEAAQAVADNADATQQQVDDAVTALTNAFITPSVGLKPLATAEKIDFSALADGDQFVIYHPSTALAMTDIATGSKLLGYEATVTGTTLKVPTNAAVLTMSVDGDSFKMLDSNGNFLTSGATGNALKFEAEDSQYALWTLDEQNGNTYIKNVNAVYGNDSTAQYLEYYSGFTTYGLGSGGAAYIFEAYQLPTPEPEQTVVFFTNDAHCASDVLDYAKVAAYAKAEPNALLVDAGDHIQGGPVGTLSKGEYIVDIMNYVGYDLAVPGNHEFDYGMDQFFKIAGVGQTGLANYPYISSNFVNLADGTPVLDATKTFTVGDVEVAFVGVSTPETLVKSTPTYFQNENGDWIYGFCHADFATFAAQVQAAIDTVQTADYVILLGHLGIDPASTPWTSEELIAAVNGVDAFIDGHSHSEVAGQIVNDKDGAAVVLAQSGTNLNNLGKLTISDEGEIAVELLPLTTATADADTEAYINGIKDTYNEQLNEVIGHTDYLLTINYPEGSPRAVRKAETNLGDLCADAYRDQMTFNGVVPDIAWVNGGGVRENIPAGDITYGQVLAVHPFGNAACLIEATGQQVLDALEFGARNAGAGENGGFLQVSGLTYKIDTSIPNGCTMDAGMWTGHEGEYRVFDVMVGGEPLDLTATYKVASHNYMLKDFGDGFAMFAGATMLQDEVMLDNEVLIGYIRDTLNGEVPAAYENLAGQGRIVFEEKPVEDIVYAYGPEVYSTELECDENGNIIYNVYLTELAENNFISGLDFDVSWDNTRLTLVDAEATSLLAPAEAIKSLTTTDVPPTININAATPADASELYYAVACSHHAWLPEDADNVLLKLVFAPAEDIANEEVVEITLSELDIALVDEEEQEVPTNLHERPVAQSGAITFNLTDSSALEQAIEDAIEFLESEDGQAMPDELIEEWEEAIQAGQDILDNPARNQEEVDQATEDILELPKADKTALEEAIEYAEEFIASEEFEDCSEELQQAWQDALESALEVLEDTDATQNECDDATQDIYNLNKTGEQTVVFAFVGIALLAVIGLAVGLKRRFNH